MTVPHNITQEIEDMNHRPEHLASGSSPPLTCRECGARPDQRGDAVSTAARAYTCSLCLCTGRRREIPATNATTQGQPSESSPARISPVDLDRVSSPEHKDGDAWKRARGGRPRKHARAADRQRAYRAHQRTYA